MYCTVASGVAARAVQMYLGPALTVLSLVLLAHRPCDGGVIVYQASSFVKTSVPVRRATSTTLPPRSQPVSSAANHNPLRNAPTHQQQQQQSSGGKFFVTSMTDDVTTAGSDAPHVKTFIVVPNLAKCKPGFRRGRNGKCYRIV
ncbi:uncharacterized protein LOC126354321 isoform X2 [Schistocerca gregaria]|uniref:uncharacterized protein LOC126354321 isoform X2 n=1 Tax=Schistocerca gregaria TaxID=7010 RepID=UPI00211EFEA0|nr:uncharacterized protein LOC126354321 isoform X2 [Schistocerca gregaria]